MLFGYRIKRVSVQSYLELLETGNTAHLIEMSIFLKIGLYICDVLRLKNIRIRVYEKIVTKLLIILKRDLGISDKDFKNQNSGSDERKRELLINSIYKAVVYSIYFGLTEREIMEMPYKKFTYYAQNLPKIFALTQGAKKIEVSNYMVGESIEQTKKRFLEMKKMMSGYRSGGGNG